MNVTIRTDGKVSERWVNVSKVDLDRAVCSVAVDEFGLLIDGSSSGPNGLCWRSYEREDGTLFLDVSNRAFGHVGPIVTDGRVA